MWKVLPLCAFVYALIASYKLVHFIQSCHFQPPSFFYSRRMLPYCAPPVKSAKMHAPCCKLWQHDFTSVRTSCRVSGIVRELYAAVSLSIYVSDSFGPNISQTFFPAWPNITCCQSKNLRKLWPIFILRSIRASICEENLGWKGFSR